MRRRRGGGAYSRKAVLFNGLGCGRLLERGRLFEKIRYTFINPTTKLLGEFFFILCDHYISDTDPPVFTFCPSDITIETIEYEKRLIWEEPRVKDNDDLFPNIRANKVPGTFFRVPGSYEIMYSATDGSGNEAKYIFCIALKK